MDQWKAKVKESKSKDLEKITALTDEIAALKSTMSDLEAKVADAESSAEATAAQLRSAQDDDASLVTELESRNAELQEMRDALKVAEESAANHALC